MCVCDREDMVIFSGGMSYERAGRTPSITVMTGKSTTVLEMEHNVIDFVVLCLTPWCHGTDTYVFVCFSVIRVGYGAIDCCLAAFKLK